MNVGRPGRNQMLFAVTLQVPATAQDGIEEYAAAGDLQPAMSRQPESATAQVQFFADSAGAAAELAQQLAVELPAWLGADAPTSTAIHVGEIRREDWAESWKRFFHVQRVSRRLVIKPSWESYAPVAGDVVLELDPGMSFGTGQHGTTRACLEFIDDLGRECPGASFLDVGCGSGILALAAWQLGFRPVTAMDNDPQAIRIARENLRRDRVRGVRLHVTDLEDVETEKTYTVVAANILAPVLIANVARLDALVRRKPAPGHLILSGILTAQYPGVTAAFAALRWREVARRTFEEWTSGRFVRAPPPKS
jgi:ribosomal protein L11 methyltransferase